MNPTARTESTSTGQARALPCAACGYDVRAHGQDASCPECGVPVVVTMRRHDVSLAEPAWVRRLGVGCRCVGLSLLGFVGTLGWAMLSDAFALSHGPSRMGWVIALLTCAGLWLWGAWCISTPDPDEAVLGTDSDRLVLRYSIVPVLLLFVVAAVCEAWHERAARVGGDVYFLREVVMIARLLVFVLGMMAVGSTFARAMDLSKRMRGDSTGVWMFRLWLATMLVVILGVLSIVGMMAWGGRLDDPAMLRMAMRAVGLVAFALLAGVGVLLWRAGMRMRGLSIA